MKFDNYDLALITDEKQRAYFLGYRSTDGYLIMTKDTKTLVIDDRYFFAAKKKLAPKGVEVISAFGYETLFRRAEELGVKRLGIDFNKTKLSEYETLKSHGFEFSDISEDLAADMSVKTDEEIKYIAKACQIAEKAWKATLPFIKKGIREVEVAALLEYNFKKYGASGTSFETIVAFGENAAVPHHETSRKKLRDNECVLMDFGCLYNGYCSDMTRTMFFGKPDDEFLNAYAAVKSAHEKAAGFIKLGVSGKAADAVAREELTKRGYGKYFTHSLGHGIGVNIHEYPNLSPKSGWKIENNMVFSNEPGVYINGKFGIRIEDSAYLCDGNYKSFMKDDKSLILLSDSGKTKKIKI